MDRQEHKEEREFGFSIMNFSRNEILKIISKRVRHGIGVTFFQVVAYIFFGRQLTVVLNFSYNDVLTC